MKSFSDKPKLREFSTIKPALQQMLNGLIQSRNTTEEKRATKSTSNNKEDGHQFSSVTRSCPTLCDPMNCSTLGLPVHHQLPESTQTHVHCVSDAIQSSPPLSPLLLLPSVFPSIRVFSNESTLHIRWPKYWSFSFNISPSNEHPGLISFRMDWLDLLAVQGTLKRLPQNQPQTIKKMAIGTYISIITLNVNGLHASTKRHRLVE